jgi:hypothetical protein
MQTIAKLNLRSIVKDSIRPDPKPENKYAFADRVCVKVMTPINTWQCDCRIGNTATDEVAIHIAVNMVDKIRSNPKNWSGFGNVNIMIFREERSGLRFLYEGDLEY